MRTIVLLSILLLFASCGSSPKKAEEQAPDVLALSTKDFNYDTLVGQYEGAFGDSPIQINIGMVTSKHAIGYNIHKGLIRNISGKLVDTLDKIILRLEEPGNNEFDGIFELTFLKSDLSVSGKWMPFKGNLSEKKFKLSKLAEDHDLPDGEFNKARVSSYFNLSSDSLGTYRFESDGLVTYEYFPTKDEDNHVDQMETISGTWTLSGKTITISWEANEIFKTRKQEYVIKVTDAEYRQYELVGKDNKIVASEY